jgi:hypothetical protein
MTDAHNVADQVQDALAHVDELRPAEELALYEEVLTQLTDLLNAPEETAPGDM